MYTLDTGGTVLRDRRHAAASAGIACRIRCPRSRCSSWPASSPRPWRRRCSARTWSPRTVGAGRRSCTPPWAPPRCPAVRPGAVLPFPTSADCTRPCEPSPCGAFPRCVTNWATSRKTSRTPGGRRARRRSHATAPANRAAEHRRDADPLPRRLPPGTGPVYGQRFCDHRLRGRAGPLHQRAATQVFPLP